MFELKVISAQDEYSQYGKILVLFHSAPSQRHDSRDGFVGKRHNPENNEFEIQYEIKSKESFR